MKPLPVQAADIRSVSWSNTIHALPRAIPPGPDLIERDPLVANWSPRRRSHRCCSGWTVIHCRPRSIKLGDGPRVSPFGKRFRYSLVIPTYCEDYGVPKYASRM